MPEGVNAPAKGLVQNAKPDGTVSVGVLIDLIKEEDAGGHVKCWERLAEAASDHRGTLDLTVYFLGRTPEEQRLAENVRLVMLTPVFSSERLPFLRASADYTDLGRYHAGLADRLGQHDVLHATDIFCFARTALRHKRRHGTPLVSSLHTDVVTFTEIYTRAIVRSMLGDNPLSRMLNEGLALPARSARSMARRLDRYLMACDHVIVSSPVDHDRLAAQRDRATLSYLRRGIDRERFSPTRSDRAWLHQHFGVPSEGALAMFAGRVDDSKGVMILAEAARRLIDDGHALHVVVCGEGAREEDVRSALGQNATLTGVVEQDVLATIYASSDLFVFPSHSDVAPNAVIEAKASGLAVLVAAGDGGAQFVERSGVDGVVVDTHEPELWAAAMARLIERPEALSEMRVAARRWAEQRWPSWADVLAEDLIPVWRRLAQVHG
ncbi:MAG: glycosyltransferase [Alphaproteobacteria bacterium]|nr:glycosyltransferase [Alphaproteobacteria bacterium]